MRTSLRGLPDDPGSSPNRERTFCNGPFRFKTNNSRFKPYATGGATAAGLTDRLQGAEDATAEIEELIAKYAAAVNREPVDIDLASSVWSNTPEASLIYPLGEERGWEQVKRNFYEHTMEARFSERTLTPHDIRVHTYGDSGWAEFSWSFVGKSRKDGSRVETNGLETQIYQKLSSHRWVFVHVHYSAMPPTERTGAPADRPL